MNTYNTFHHGPRKGQPKTLTDRVIRYLVEGRGLQEVNSKSKYRQFIDPKNLVKYFAGKAGAVRTGQNASNSQSITDIVRKNMEAWEIKKRLFIGEEN